MTFKGLDDQQMDVFAQHVEDASHTLRDSHTLLSKLLRGTPWFGPLAERFLADWSGAHTSRVRGAETLLNDLARDLRAEASAQRAASGGAPANTAGSGAWPGPRLQKIAEDVLTGYAGLTGGLALLATFGRASAGSGRYTNAWRQVIAHGGDLMRYKSSPTIQAAQGNPLFKGAAQIIDNPTFAGASKFLGGALALQSGISLWGNVAAGDRAAARDNAVDLVATGLRSKMNPVLYLAGVNVSIWNDVFKESQNFARDFRPEDGLPDPFGKDGPAIYWQTAKDVGGQLTKMATKWF